MNATILGLTNVELTITKTAKKPPVYGGPFRFPVHCQMVCSSEAPNFTGCGLIKVKRSQLPCFAGLAGDLGETVLDDKVGVRDHAVQLAVRPSLSPMHFFYFALPRKLSYRATFHDDESVGTRDRDSF